MIRVTGGVTGKVYRFAGYGSVVAVDDRDSNVRSMPNMIVVSQ